MEEKSTPMFKMKKALHYLEGHGFVNQNSCTDELALRILAENSAHIQKFEVFPGNWNDLVNEYKQAQAAAKAPKAEAPKVEEKAPEKPQEEATEAKTEQSPEEEKAEEVPTYQAKLIALDGIAEKTAQKIIADFPTEDALAAHIAAGKDLSYSPQANKALLEAYA